jgi:hypothetical protein
MSEATETIKDVVQYALDPTIREFRGNATHPAEAAQVPVDVAIENAEAEYADMPYWELLLRIKDGEITDPAAAKIYLQKVKEAELLTVRNVAAKHPEDKTNWLDAEVTDIQTKYDPLIIGTHQDRARYFAQEAQSMLSNYHTGEMKVKANQRAANMFTYAGILARQEAKPQGAKSAEPPPSEKIQAVRAELAQAQTTQTAK